LGRRDVMPQEEIDERRHGRSNGIFRGWCEGTHQGRSDGPSQERDDESSKKVVMTYLVTGATRGLGTVQKALLRNEVIEELQSSFST
jgi:hypothetical protein